MHFLPAIKERTLSVALLFLFTLAFSIQGKAAYWYVVYLNNGTILRCQSYRHLPDSTYRVKINRDTVLNIPESQVYDVSIIHYHVLKGYEFDYKYDSVGKNYMELPNHYVHQRGFFFQWQLSVVAIDGMRLIMGYRFNTYIALGLGLGAEYGFTFSHYNGVPQTGPGIAPSYVYNSGYSPFYLCATGDFLKTKATSFYSIELGYNLPWYPHLQTDPEDGAIQPPYSFYTNYGGPTTGLGLGCRIYSRKRSNVSVSLNMNVAWLYIKTNAFEGYPYPYYPPSNPIYVTSISRYLMLQPSLRFSAGF